MVSFVNDYSAGAHPKIMERLLATNLEKTVGYGEDEYCAEAKDKIRLACECPDAQIYFLQGGTQTNQVAIDTMLHPTEGVICAATGHINVHEAGAIEFTGHKVLALPTDNGTLKPLRYAISARASTPMKATTMRSSPGSYTSPTRPSWAACIRKRSLRSFERSAMSIICRCI